MELDEAELRRRARERVNSGALPSQPETRLWGGQGTGLRCALCDAPSERDQIEHEMQFEENGQLRTVRFHAKCAAAWELERSDARTRSKPG